jgi:hypothetical protein
VNIGREKLERHQTGPAVFPGEELVLELDSDATMALRPSDTVVQNGPRHRWSNPGNIPALLAGWTWGVPHEHITGSETQTSPDVT